MSIMLDSKPHPNNIHITPQANNELIVSFDKGQTFGLNIGKMLDCTTVIFQDCDGVLITFSSTGDIHIAQPIRKIAHYLYDMIIGLCYEFPVRPTPLEINDQTSKIIVDLGSLRLTMSLPAQIHWNGNQDGIAELNELMTAYDKLQVMR